MAQKLTYVCSPFRSEADAGKAQEFCKALIGLGHLPVAPQLYFPQFLNLAVPAEHEKYRAMSQELLRRSSLVVVCGGKPSADMHRDIVLAKQLGKHCTTLEGIQAVEQLSARFYRSPSKGRQKEHGPDTPVPPGE